MTPLGRSVERAARTCAHSLVLCARAEDLACAALARHDPYGQADWDAVRWAHLLDRLARSHTRAQLIKMLLANLRCVSCRSGKSSESGSARPRQRGLG